MDTLFQFLALIFAVLASVFAMLWWSKKSDRQTHNEKLLGEKEEKDFLQKEFFRIETQNEELQKNIGAHEKEREQLEKNILTVQTQMQSKQEEIIRLESELKNISVKNSEIEADLKNEREEKHSLEGKGKSVFVQNTKLEEENKMLKQERDEMREKLTKFENEKTLRDEEFTKKVEKLEHSREIFEKEKERVVREDEEKRKQENEMRDRVWNEHENSILTQLRDICSLPEIGFLFYENTSLPAEFDGRIKPDFLIKFLDQYLIFDAKAVKPESKNSPQNYFSDQVKSTAKKYVKKEYIYPTVFFILPEDQVSSMKKRSAFEGGISFFAVSPSSILPVLSLLKKITEYDNIKEFNPQDREDIVHLFANYDRHISYQNAANLVLAQKSIDLMDAKKTLPEDFQSDIVTQKQKMKDFSLTPTEIKKFSPLETQKKEIEQITQPKAGIDKSDLEEVEKLF